MYLKNLKVLLQLLGAWIPRDTNFHLCGIEMTFLRFKQNKLHLFCVM